MLSILSIFKGGQGGQGVSKLLILLKGAQGAQKPSLVSFGRTTGESTLKATSLDARQVEDECIREVVGEVNDLLRRQLDDVSEGSELSIRARLMASDSV
jgi:hypothetical protein